VSKTPIFRRFFGRKYLKTITSLPGHRAGDRQSSSAYPQNRIGTRQCSLALLMFIFIFRFLEIFLVANAFISNFNTQAMYIKPMKQNSIATIPLKTLYNCGI
jgi:hypothetical protein